MFISIITALIPAMGVIFGAAMTYKIVTYNFNKPKKHSVLENELELVFSPIHCILSIPSKFNDDEKFSMIDNIIRTNYTLIHPSICEEFYGYPFGNPHFIEQIDKCYNYARAKLGYEQVKMRKFDTQTKKLVGNDNSLKTNTIFNGAFLASIVMVPAVLVVFLSFSTLVTFVTSTQRAEDILIIHSDITPFYADELNGSAYILIENIDTISGAFTVASHSNDHVAQLNFYGDGMLIYSYSIIEDRRRPHDFSIDADGTIHVHRPLYDFMLDVRDMSILTIQFNVLSGDDVVCSLIIVVP